MIRASYSLKIFPNFNEEEVDLSVSRHFIYISLLTRVNYRNIYFYSILQLQYSVTLNSIFSIIHGVHEKSK